MGNRLQDKVALITGGTSGIGEATAALFVAEGARVVITGRSEEKGAGIAARLGEHCAYVRADVTREADIAASVDATLERFGRLDVLFNNAGAGVRTTLDTITTAQIEEGVRLLLSSVMLGIRYAVEPMKANGGGAIINNSSIAGLRYRQGDLLYSAIKAGGDALLQAGRRRAGPVRHPRQRDLARRHRHADLLGRLGAREHAQRRGERAQDGEAAAQPRQGVARCAGRAWPTTSPRPRCTWPATPAAS